MTGAISRDALGSTNQVLALILVALGLICLLTQKHIIKQLIGLNIMLQGPLLLIVDAGRVTNDIMTAQSMAVSSLVAETIVIAVGLTLVVNAFRHHPTGDTDEMNVLKG